MDRTEVVASRKFSHDHRFTTSDGIALHYLDFGSGRPILMVPGWSQTAEMFREQLLPLSKHFRCLAVDMRGHGESQQGGQGYTIDRFATDLSELISSLGLEQPILLGHSMGAAVLWRYVEKYGVANVSKMIFVDQAPVLLKRPEWSTEQCQRYGAIFDADSLESVCAGLVDPKNYLQVTRNLLHSMFTDSFPAEQLEWVLSENFKFERTAAAALLRDHCNHDWREIIKTVTPPSLVIGGKASFMPWQSQQWLSENLPNAKLVLFEPDQGGQHFMFLENPAVFNKVICNFCQ